MRLSICLACVALITATAALAQEEGQIDVRGGIFEGQMDTQPHERKSRLEEVRQNRVDRNPRNVPERQIVDGVLDATVDSATANTTKHGLDAVQNINEAIQIRNKRIDENSSSSAPTQE